MSILIFLVVLGILVIVHEWGHYITAVKLGVKVEKFSIGFGPKVFSTQKGDTEFMVCLIPLGGYVKMAGDERIKCKGDKSEFFSKPVGHRSLIVLMGPVVNYVLAYLCFVVVFLIGYPSLSAKVGEVLEDYPAQAAGILPGDKVVRIDDKDIENWEQLQQYITMSQHAELIFVVERDGGAMVIPVRPEGDVITNVFGQEQKVRVVGIRPEEDISVLKYGFFESFGQAYVKLKDITVLTFKALYRMATGAMSAKEAVTGPIGIFFIVKKAAALGISYLLFIMGLISASLAIFNLLPLPVLDGGHLAFFGLEKIRGKALSEKTEDIIMRVGITLIICLALFVFYIDFVRFGVFDKIFSIFQKG